MKYDRHQHRAAQRRVPIGRADRESVKQIVKGDADVSGQAEMNVMRLAMLGGVLGMRRTFILHANGSKLPTDFLGLTCIRYGEGPLAAEMRKYRRIAA